MVDWENPLGELYAMAYRHAEATGGDTSVVTKLCDLACAETAVLTVQRDRAHKSRLHTEQWYAERIERLKDLGVEKGCWPEMAAIIANGSVTSSDPPTYARQLNIALHRAVDAERRAEYAEGELAQLRARPRSERAADATVGSRRGVRQAPPVEPGSK